MLYCQCRLNEKIRTEFDEAGIRADINTYRIPIISKSAHNLVYMWSGNQPYKCKQKQTRAVLHVHCVAVSK